MGKTVLDITGGSLRAKVNEKLSSIASTVKHKNAISNGIVEENTYYELGTITSAPTITAVENSYDESVIIFTVGGSESIPAFPFIPSGYKLVDIPIKEFSVGSKYVICYWNSTVIIKRLFSSTKANGETWNGYAWSDYNNRSNTNTSVPGSEFKYAGDYDSIDSDRDLTRFIYTYEGHDRLVVADRSPYNSEYGPYRSLTIWSQGTDGEITSNGSDIHMVLYMKGTNRLHYEDINHELVVANNYAAIGSLSDIDFLEVHGNGENDVDALTADEKTELNNNKENYNISAIRFGSIVTDFSIQSERDARYIEDFEVDNGNTVLSFDGVSLNKTVYINKKTSLFVIPSKITITSSVLDLSSLSVEYINEYSLIGFEDPSNEHYINPNITEIILPSSIKGFDSPGNSNKNNVFSYYYGSFSTNVREAEGTEITIRYPGTIAQATSIIDQLRDPNAYNFSTVPAYIVCSDGTINTQSLFNS